MHWVNMTGFITHCWKSAGFEIWRAGRWLLGAWLLVCVPVWAQSTSAELTEFKVERQDSSLLLNAQFKLELGPAVEDALVKGLAVHFVAEAEIMAGRWKGPLHGIPYGLKDLFDTAGIVTGWLGRQGF